MADVSPLGDSALSGDPRFLSGFLVGSMHRPKTLLIDGTWATAGQLLAAIGSLVSVRLITQLISPEAYGRLTLWLGIAALALGLSITPRLQALMRYYPEYASGGRAQDFRFVGLQSIRGYTAAAAAMVACIWPLGSLLLGGPWHVGILLACLLIADSIRSFELALFNSARRQRAAACVYVADAWSRPIIGGACVIAFGRSSEMVLTGYVLGSALVVAFMYGCVRLEGLKESSVAIASDGKVGSALGLEPMIRRYAIPLLPLAIFGWISGVGDRYVIGGVLGLGPAGLYAAAYGLASRPFQMLSGTIELSLRPVLQTAIASRDLRSIKSTMRAWLMIAGLGSLAGAACFWCFSDILVSVFLAADYKPTAGLLPWIAAGMAVYNMSTVYTRFCYALDDTVAVFILVAAGSVVGLAVMIPAVLIGGLRGAAISIPCYFGIQLLLAMALSDRAERRFRRASLSEC